MRAIAAWAVPSKAQQALRPCALFDPMRTRARVFSTRLAITTLAATCLTCLLVYLGSCAAGVVAAWLNRQSQYQLAFDDIDLVRDLPSWYRGGKREFLSRVRKSSGNPERISQLEVRPDRIAKAFRLDPWVEEVMNVTYSPGRIAVDLKFREPVAAVRLASGQPQIIDGQARLLPSEDVDVELVSPAFKITGAESTPPADPSPGVVWKTTAGAADPDRVDETILAAASLAAFLKQHMNALGAESPPALRMTEIMLADPKVFGEHRLFTANTEGTIFWWGSRPGPSLPESRPPTRSGRSCSGGTKSRPGKRWPTPTTGRSRRRAFPPCAGTRTALIDRGTLPGTRLEPTRSAAGRKGSGHQGNSVSR